VPARETIRFPGGGEASRIVGRPVCGISVPGSAPFAHVPLATARLDLSSEKMSSNARS
jgi:hypothetical protein